MALTPIQKFGQEPPFVGRLDELQLLDTLLLSELPQAVVIQGPSGSGKSRLVSEFSAVAARTGLRPTRGVCYNVRPAAPFLPVLQLLASPEQGIAPLTERLSKEKREAAVEDAGVPLSVVAFLGDRLLFEGTAGKTLLVVEDLHWCDPDSLLLLNHLIDLAGGRLRLICTLSSDARPTANSAHLVSRLVRKITSIDLPALGEGESASLVMALCRPYALRPSEVSYLANLAGGNPLFLCEIANQLRASGSLAVQDVSQVLASQGLPRNLTQLIDGRLRVLSSDALEALQAASVIGQQFEIEALQVATVGGAYDLRACLAEAEESGNVRAIDPPDATTYEFAHPLIRERLYRLLPGPAKRVIHRRLGESYRSLPVEQLAVHLAHALEGEERAAALPACEQAAEGAERLMAYESASHFWRLALACVRPGGQGEQVRLLNRLGMAYKAGGNWQQALRAFQRAFRLSDGGADRETRAGLAFSIAEMLRFRSEYAECKEWLETTLELAGEGSARRGPALALLASAHIALDQAEAAIPLIAQALGSDEESESAGPEVCYWASYAYTAIGSQRRSARLASIGLERATRDGDTVYGSLLAGLLVHTEIMSLRYERAARLVALQESALNLRDPVAFARTMISRSLLEAYSGNWDRVIRVCERWMAEVRLAGDFQLATARLTWAEAVAATGEIDAGIAGMEEALPFLETMQALAAMHLARLLVVKGDEQTAVELVNRHYAEIVASSRRQAARAFLGDVVAAVGSAEQRGEVYARLLEERRPMLVVYTPISVPRVLGKLAASTGAWASAFGHFETAVSQLSEGRARWELALAWSDYARARRHRGRRGDQLKAEALEAEAERLLGSLGRRRAGEEPSMADPYGLSARELEVLRFVAAGLKNQEIAERLVISPHTVDRHLENIFSKMSVTGRTQAVLAAVGQGLIKLD